MIIMWCKSEIVTALVWSAFFFTSIARSQDEILLELNSFLIKTMKWDI